jgi:hypothetical protein
MNSGQRVCFMECIERKKVKGRKEERKEGRKEGREFL